MSARQEPPDPETEDLRRVVEDVAGVVRAEVDGSDDGRPVVRVHLDGSRPQDIILGEVRDAVARWRSATSKPSAVLPPRPRRGGLGKSLGVLLAEAASPTNEPRLPSDEVRPGDRSMTSVAVLSGEFGSSLRAIDSEGTVAVVLGVGENLVQSVVSAVATLLDIDVPQLLGVDDRTIGGHHIVTVVLAAGTAGIRTGSATVGHDRLLGVGQAAWAAMGR